MHTFIAWQSWKIFILYAELLVLLNYCIDSNPLLSQATCHDNTTIGPLKIDRVQTQKINYKKLPLLIYKLNTITNSERNCIIKTERNQYTDHSVHQRRKHDKIQLDRFVHVKLS
jgi:hypothetical protein